MNRILLSMSFNFRIITMTKTLGLSQPAASFRRPRPEWLSNKRGAGCTSNEEQVLSRVDSVFIAAIPATRVFCRNDQGVVLSPSLFPPHFPPTHSISLSHVSLFLSFSCLLLNRPGITTVYKEQ